MSRAVDPPPTTPRGRDHDAPESSARSASRRWPAEWDRHRATWLAWPHNKETWPGCLDQVEDAYAEIVRAILPGEAVEILVLDRDMADRVGKQLHRAGVNVSDGLRFHVVETDDAWIRDHGGIFVQDGTGEVARSRLIDFAFNAWGGKYPPWDLDARVASEMARLTKVVSTRLPVVLEAGSIDGDGAGTILTTESCLLNANRVVGGEARSQSSMEDLLADTLGARRVLWLGDGIRGDDTDGHVDDLTRFVGPARVVTSIATDPAHPDFATLRANRRRLEEMTDADGRRLEIVDLPMPDPVSGPDGRLPASYANFYFANAALLVPTFGVDQDREALSILSRFVRDRPVVAIPSRHLVLGLGAVHCLTQQEPALIDTA